MTVHSHDHVVVASYSGEEDIPPSLNRYERKEGR